MEWVSGKSVPPEAAVVIVVHRGNLEREVLNVRKSGTYKTIKTSRRLGRRWASWGKMPLCSRCKKLKRESEFYTYRTKAGLVLVKNPCADCRQQLSKSSKTCGKQLTDTRIEDKQVVVG